MNSELDVSDIAALSPGTAIHAKGKQRVQEILRVATEVLAFEGYSSFTMRYIAGRLEMSLANLQYYFQTKESLFQAVIERMLNQELATARDAVERPGLSHEERFRMFLEYSIKDNETPLIRGFQFELWALATRDPFAAECRDKMTSAYCDFIFKLVAPLTPELSEAEQRTKAALILALLQGLPLIIGDGVNIGSQLVDLEREIFDEAMAILNVAER
jgi:AcrR family transcriptional regulator